MPQLPVGVAGEVVPDEEPVAPGEALGEVRVVEALEGGEGGEDVGCAGGGGHSGSCGWLGGGSGGVGWGGTTEEGCPFPRGENCLIGRDRMNPLCAAMVSIDCCGRIFDVDNIIRVSLTSIRQANQEGRKGSCRVVLGSGLP